jgi:hypothetical protein
MATTNADFMFKAIEKNKLQVVEGYLDKGVDPNTVNSSGTPVFFYATTLEMVKLFVNRGANINKTDSNGNTFFIFIDNVRSFRDENDRYTLLQYLFSKGFQINKDLILFYLTLPGYFNILEYLLHNIDLNALFYFDLFFIKKEEFVEKIIQKLFIKPSTISNTYKFYNIGDKFEEPRPTPEQMQKILSAVQQYDNNLLFHIFISILKSSNLDDTELISLLQDLFSIQLFDIYQKDNKNNTLLHLLFYFYPMKNFDIFYGMVQLLLQNNFDPNEDNDDGNSPFSMFLMNNPNNYTGNIALTKLFLQYGAKNKQVNISKVGSTIQKLLQNSITVPKNFDVTPKIYVPLGHSDELQERILVPNNVMFVSFNTCGLITPSHQEGIVELFNDAKTKTETQLKEFYGNPNANNEQIQQILGRQQMYIKVPHTKDTLPNIQYTLLRFWNTPTGLEFLYSGLTPIEQFQNKDFHTNFQILQPNQIKLDFFTNFLPSLFQFSEKPTQQEVINAFGTLDNLKQTILDNPQLLPIYKQSRIEEFRKNPALLTFDTFPSPFITVSWFELAENIDKCSIFNISLYELIKDFPGIYYHFMCRGRFATESNAKEHFYATRRLSIANASLKNKTKKNKKNKNNKNKNNKNRQTIKISKNKKRQTIKISKNNNLTKFSLTPKTTYIFTK